MNSLNDKVLDYKGLTLCCCIYSAQYTKVLMRNIGVTTIVTHIIGFFGGILPFLILNITSDIPGFMFFIILPTIFILFLGYLV